MMKKSISGTVLVSFCSDFFLLFFPFGLLFWPISVLVLALLLFSCLVCFGVCFGFGFGLVSFYFSDMVLVSVLALDLVLVLVLVLDFSGFCLLALSVFLLSFSFSGWHRASGDPLQGARLQWHLQQGQHLHTTDR
jgi:hypothetical protein